MPTVLITGANRGVGFELTKAFASAGYKTIAAVRDVSTMPKIDGGVVVKIDANSKTDAAAAVKELQAKGINEVDIVIANAAVNLTRSNFSELSIEDLEETFNINVRGQLVLFQSMLPLLPKNGTFCFISSGAGTINKKQVPEQGCYGLSKAALNFMMRKMQAEHPDLLIFSLSPGWLPTSMGNQGAIWRGLEKAPDDMDKAVAGMLKLIGEGDKEKLGGWMTDWQGSRMEF